PLLDATVGALCEGPVGDLREPLLRAHRVPLTAITMPHTRARRAPRDSPTSGPVRRASRRIGVIFRTLGGGHEWMIVVFIWSLLICSQLIERAYRSRSSDRSTPTPTIAVR